MLINLAHKPHYELAAAMRGPDEEKFYPFKELTTGVLRFLAGVDSNAEMVVISPDYAKEKWNKLSPERKKHLQWLWNRQGGYHFQAHVTWAFNALVDAGVDGAEDYRDWFRDEVILKYDGESHA